MRRAGILIGSTGRNGNVLKIRPPLVFQKEHADQVAETMGAVLARA
jgi:4-aminobutyrate aminotransferase-like enzyme